MHARNLFPHRSALFLALLAAGAAHAQDSGLGVDLHFGNALDPSGQVASVECDPRGSSWLLGDRERTPTGFLYGCIPETDEAKVNGEWHYLASIGFGYMYVAGDKGNSSFLRYTNYDDGLIFNGVYSAQRASDGSYVDLRASRLDEDNQFLRLVAGQAGKFKVQAFARSQGNVLSHNAQSLWSNLGEQNLVLAPGLTPGATTAAEVDAFMAANPATTVSVNRDKQGLGINYFLNPRWTMFFNAAQEQRSGSRPFGGPFSFGRLVEVLRPIDDSTTTFNGGARFVGNKWRAEFTYSGSFFRNDMAYFTYEMPYTTTNNNPRGLFSYEPENDYHRIGATLTRKLRGNWNGEFSLSTAFTHMRQDEDLVPGLFGCTGMLNATVSCDNWNTPASLSRSSADLGIDGTRVNAKLVLQPSNAVTWRSNFNYQREDYDGTYVAYNPLTGQYGYIGENGAFPNTVWVPGGSNLVHVKNLPLDKETWEASTSADWRINRKNTLGASLGFTRVERTHREVEETDDLTFKLTWINRTSEKFTLRANYVYLDRSGSEYEPDPYEFMYSHDLPGFVVPANGLAPHTIDDMRKYDVGEREQHKVDVMGTVVLSPTMTLYASVRAERNDYDAVIGRRGYDTMAGSVQWEWQAGLSTTVNAWYGIDRSSLDVANTNDVPAGRGDSGLGGPNYPLDYRWWMTDKSRNHNAGAGFHHDFGKVSFDLDWNYIYANGETSWLAASTQASPTATAAGLEGSFPDMVWRINSLRASVKVPFTAKVGAKFFAAWEEGHIFDWHYKGMDADRTTGNMIYTDGGPEGYDSHVIGMLVEVKL